MRILIQLYIIYVAINEEPSQNNSFIQEVHLNFATTACNLEADTLGSV